MSPPKSRQNDALASAYERWNDPCVARAVVDDDVKHASRASDVDSCVGYAPAEGAQPGDGVEAGGSFCGGDRGEYCPVVSVDYIYVDMMRRYGDLHILSVGGGYAFEVFLKPDACGSAAEQPSGVVGEQISHHGRAVV